ncbi:MAG: DHH family phosphoesterase [Candidatus Cloacimonetes bacterium]|nr:DHH family phosphoesterase [Candidatus Cloacimonadota bacterium]
MFIYDLEQINNLFKLHSGKRIAITTHENPDGDGLATSLALYYCLDKIYQAEPYIIIDSVFPTFLDFLNYQHCRIMDFEEYKKVFIDKFELLVVLDCHEEDRVDTVNEIFLYSKKVLVIDHHEAKKKFIKEEYLYYLDNDAVSTGVMLHRIIESVKLKNYIANDLLNTNNETKPINTSSFVKDYVDCIYTSILNDTDNFVNSNAKRETFLVVADLIDMGLETHIIVNQFLNKKPIFYYKFIGDVLSTIKLNKNKKIVYYVSTLKMLRDNHQDIESYSKMMRWTKGAYDVEVQVLFQEYENNVWRISLRSDLYDVSQMAQYFGGGGHKKASGFQLEGNFNFVKKNVISFIEEQIKKSPSSNEGHIDDEEKY